MNRTAKIILGTLSGLIVLCLLAAVAGIFLFRSAGSVISSVARTDPVKAEDVSSSIAEYTLPDGFGDPYAANLVGFSIVTYTHTDGHSHISFFQLPKGVTISQADIEKQFRQTTGNKSGYGKQPVRQVDQVEGTIAGQQVTLAISEGTNSSDQPFREVSGVFQGKGGQAMVVYEAPLSRWDQAEVDAFLASIQ